MSDWLLFVLKSFYLVLPGIAANIAPVLVRRVPFLAYPVDFGRTFRGRPLFGKNKTYRGFFFGILASILVVSVQKSLYALNEFKFVSFVDYATMPAVLFGFLIGFGVLLGDLVKSFFKRQTGVAPGERFFPWDQLDSIVGGFLFLSLVFIPPLSVVVFLLLFLPLVHIGMNHAAFYLGLKETRW